MLRALSIIGLISFSFLFCYLTYEEKIVCARASATRTMDTPEYVHERYQRCYFSVPDAQKLGRIHNEQAIVLLAIVSCGVAFVYLRRKSRNRTGP